MKRIMLLALLACACASFADYKTEVAMLQERMTDIRPGLPEDSLRVMFEPVKSSGPYYKIGFLDVQQYVAEGYLARTWWIGYYAKTPYPERVSMVSVECVNGAVANVLTY